jgi:tetratricopeptide (TPR) repeat protein
MGFGLLALVAVAASGCGYIGMLKAKMAFKDANQLYTNQDYRAAAAKYEEVLANDPNLTYAYFFLGNSYDQQYRSVKRGDPANDAMLTKAIENYKKSAEVEQNPQIKQRALEYLVSAYGPDKLNDPAQAEPILLNMIKMDPKETSSYFGLANIYEQSGDYERAEKMLTDARNAKPNDPAVYMQLAGFYNRQGEFNKTMDALYARAKQEPTNPEAHYTIATYFWEKAYRDFTTPEADKVKFVKQGLESVDEAIRLNPKYFEALTYKNLLLRVQANLEKNPAKQQELLKQANEWRDKAQAVRTAAKAAGAGE